MEKLLGKYWTDTQSFVFLGETGCGKSEIAINLSLQLLEEGRPVHLFDMDMTKPLFRSRDIARDLEDAGIQFHYEEQFADAPTMVGGVARQLRSRDSYTVLDVGGDHIGARAIGGYAPLLHSALICCVINPFRPWARNGEDAAAVLGSVLTAARLPMNRVVFLGNPYLGEETTPTDIEEGYYRLLDMLQSPKLLAGICIAQTLAPHCNLPVPIYPIQRYIHYPW